MVQYVNTLSKPLNPNRRETNEQRPVMCPFPNGREVASIRRDKTGDMANCPFILDSNIKTMNNLLATKRQGDFDLDELADRKELSERIREAANSPEKMNELASFRKFQLTNDVMPSPFALAMYQIVDLAPEELPMIERPRSKNMQRFTVRTQSYDGGAEMAQWMTTREALTLEPETLATDRVSYQLVDIRQGDVSAYNEVNETLKLDMDMKIDSLARSNADAAQAASGLRALLNIHPSIVAANLPDKNYHDLNAVDTAGVLSIGKLKTILNAVALLTSAFPNEGLQLRSVFMSPQNVRDAWDFTNLVSGVDGNLPDTPADTVPESVREQIFATGGFMRAWGMSMNWVPNPLIAKGRMYFVFNKPIGWCFTKRSFDKLLRWDESNSIQHAEANYGELMYKRVLSFYRPDLWKYRIIMVDL